MFPRRRRRLHSDIFSLGTLSPRHGSTVDGRLSVDESSAMLLHCDSVTFPFLGRVREQILHLTLEDLSSLLLCGFVLIDRFRHWPVNRYDP